MSRVGGWVRVLLERSDFSLCSIDGICAAMKRRGGGEWAAMVMTARESLASLYTADAGQQPSRRGYQPALLEPNAVLTANASCSEAHFELSLMTLNTVERRERASLPTITQPVRN